MSWERDLQEMTKGMTRHYQKMVAENPWHRCEKCDFGVGKYPGRYPRYCPSCGADMVQQESYPRKADPDELAKDDPQLVDVNEASPYRDRAQVVATLDAMCEDAHALSDYPLVPWSPSQRIVRLEGVDEGVALFSVFAPAMEAQRQVIGSIRVPLGECTPKSLYTEAMGVIRAFAARVGRELSILPRHLHEVDSLAFTGPNHTGAVSSRTSLSDDEEMDEGYQGFEFYSPDGGLKRMWVKDPKGRTSFFVKHSDRWRRVQHQEGKKVQGRRMMLGNPGVKQVMQQHFSVGEEEADENLANTMALTKDNDIGQKDKKQVDPEYTAQPDPDSGGDEDEDEEEELSEAANVVPLERMVDGFRRDYKAFFRLIKKAEKKDVKTLFDGLVRMMDRMEKELLPMQGGSGLERILRMISGAEAGEMSPVHYMAQPVEAAATELMSGFNDLRKLLFFGMHVSNETVWSAVRKQGMGMSVRPLEDTKKKIYAAGLALEKATTKLNQTLKSGVFDRFFLKAKLRKAMSASPIPVNHNMEGLRVVSYSWGAYQAGDSHMKRLQKFREGVKLAKQLTQRRLPWLWKYMPMVEFTPVGETPAVGSAAGYYDVGRDPSRSRIRIADDVVSRYSPLKIAETLIHEAAHHMWFQVLSGRDTKAWEEEFNDSQAKKHGLTTTYSKTSVVESFAEFVMTFVVKGRRGVHPQGYKILKNILGSRVTESVQEAIKPIDRDKADPFELQVGVQVEFEHTTDREKAERIALQHITEDPKYYWRMYKAGLATKEELGEQLWDACLEKWGKPDVLTHKEGVDEMLGGASGPDGASSGAPEGGAMSRHSHTAGVKTQAIKEIDVDDPAVTARKDEADALGNRYCAWCGKHMGTKMVVGGGDTHGMCKDCYQKVKAQILNRKKTKKESVAATSDPVRSDRAKIYDEKETVKVDNPTYQGVPVGSKNKGDEENLVQESVIRWSKPRVCRPGVPMMVNLGRFEAEWKKNDWQYLPPSGANDIGNRRNRIKAGIERGSCFPLPEVGFSENGEELLFDDGRHRVATLRDMGVKAMPMWVAKEDVSRFQKKFGAVPVSLSVTTQVTESATVPGDQGTTEFKSAAAIIIDEQGRILLGLARADDDRNGMWCFPGGGIDLEDGGDPTLAAVREAYEETSLEVSALGPVLSHPDRPGVAFVPCRYLSGESIPNQEFESFQWLPKGAHHDFPGIYPVNKSVIEQVPEGFFGPLNSEAHELEEMKMDWETDLTSNLLSEGVHDKYICKAVFMAGGGGSGKSGVASHIFDIGKGRIPLSGLGVKTINSDELFELLAEVPKVRQHMKDLKDLGDKVFSLKPKSMGGDMDSDEIQKRIRPLAGKLAAARQRLYMAGRLPIAIDGTGAKTGKLLAAKKQLESIGYDCYMVYVQVDVETAVKRNKNRDRTVPEDVLRKDHALINAALPVYKSEFGGNLQVVVTGGLVGSDWSKAGGEWRRIAQRFLQSPIKNPIGKEWVKSEMDAKRAMKKIGESQESKWEGRFRSSLNESWEDVLSESLFLEELRTAMLGEDGRKLSQGKPAEKDPRAKPGTSMKAPEKQEPVNTDLSKEQKDSLAKKTLSDPSEPQDTKKRVDQAQKDGEKDAEDKDGDGKPDATMEPKPTSNPQAVQTNFQQLPAAVAPDQSVNPQQNPPPQQAPQPQQAQAAAIPDGAKTIQFLLRSEGEASKAGEWLQAMGLQNTQVNGPKVLTFASTSEDLIIIQRMANAFDLQLGGFQPKEKDGSEKANS